MLRPANANLDLFRAHTYLSDAPLVQRLGYEPSKLETRVRLPDGASIHSSYFWITTTTTTTIVTIPEECNSSKSVTLPRYMDFDTAHTTSRESTSFGGSKIPGF